MLGHTEMQHLAATMLQYHEHEQDPQHDGRHGEEIDRHHLVQVVVKKGRPGLTRRAAESAEDARNRALGDLDAEHP